jgi:hypothetical protein
MLRITPPLVRSNQKQLLGLFAVVGLVALLASATSAADWPRFRGPNGSGIAADAPAPPITWSETENLKWSIDLPGQGVSCPIVVGDRVYVTSWTGDGPDNLVRHLVCYDRATGEQIFDKSIAPVVQDEPYEGMFRQTGYTASSPASDGERVYCFFGVSGVYAFDMNGTELWRSSVGTQFDDRKWGTASSPVPVGDLVIVPAAAESKSIVALRKSDGSEAWRFDSPVLNGTWSSPVVVDTPSGGQELVFAVPGQVWAFDPATGKQLWTCQGAESNSACASPIAADGIVYAIGGREGGGLAIRAGGSGDVTESHVVWSGNQRARIGTPVLEDGLIYWISDGTANCIDAATGERVYQNRLKPQEDVAQTRRIFHLVAEETAAEEVPANAPAVQAADGQQPGQRPGEGRGQVRGRRRGGGGGGFMSQDYSSPVVAGDKMYYVRRDGATYVFKLGREFEQLAVNKFPGEADYSASPAIADGQMFIRSSKKLYCVAKE